MAKRVVCISRTLGAGGEDVALQVARDLGFRYIDDEIVLAAADKAGVSPEEIAKAEHTQPLVVRIMEALAAAPMVSESGYIAATVPVPNITYSQVIAQVIREVAEAGNAVILAHGASHALSGRTDALRVLITASPDTRENRLAQGDGLDAAGARKSVEASDRERAKYLDRFYNVRHELPTQYDLTLNTDTMAVPTAIALIIAAART